MTAGTMAVYLALDPVDLRGAFDRLAAITRQVLSLDPASGALFLFFNKKRNRLKALWWDRNGYTILYN
jgi:transposase